MNPPHSKSSWCLLGPASPFRCCWIPSNKGGYHRAQELSHIAGSHLTQEPATVSRDKPPAPWAGSWLHEQLPPDASSCLRCGTVMKLEMSIPLSCSISWWFESTAGREQEAAAAEEFTLKSEGGKNPHLFIWYTNTRPGRTPRASPCLFSSAISLILPHHRLTAWPISLGSKLMTRYLRQWNWSTSRQGEGRVHLMCFCASVWDTRAN